MGEKAVQALTPNPHPPNLGFGTVIKEIWAQFSRKFIWLLIISSRIATKCNFKYFTSILALCFHSPKRSVQSVSMSGFWLKTSHPPHNPKHADVTLECTLSSIQQVILVILDQIPSFFFEAQSSSTYTDSDLLLYHNNLSLISMLKKQILLFVVHMKQTNNCSLVVWVSECSSCVSVRILYLQQYNYETIKDNLWMTLSTTSWMISRTTSKTTVRISLGRSLKTTSPSPPMPKSVLEALQTQLS